MNCLSHQICELLNKGTNKAALNRGRISVAILMDVIHWKYIHNGAHVQMCFCAILSVYQQNTFDNKTLVNFAAMLMFTFKMIFINEGSLIFNSHSDDTFF